MVLFNCEKRSDKCILQGAEVTKLQEIFKRILISDYFVLYLIFVYIAIIYPFAPLIVSPLNLSDVFSNMWPLFIIALGQCVVLITAGIDLSQIAVISFSSILAGILLTTSVVDPSVFEHYPIWNILVDQSGGILSQGDLYMIFAIFIIIAISAIIGTINGISVAYFKIPPFIATLITQMFISALALWMTKSDSLASLPDNFYNISEYEIFEMGSFVISSSFIVGIGVGLIIWYILKYTLLGAHLFAVGTNMKTAKVSGINTTKVIIIAYVISSICAAIGAILYSSRLEIGRPSLGNFSMLMDIIGANVIAGVSLFGGRGKVSLTLFGVIFFILLANSLSLIGVEFYVNEVIKGGAIAFAATIDVFRMRYMNKA